MSSTVSFPFFLSWRGERTRHGSFRGPHHTAPFVDLSFEASSATPPSLSFYATVARAFPVGPSRAVLSVRCRVNGGQARRPKVSRADKSEKEGKAPPFSLSCKFTLARRNVAASRPCACRIKMFISWVCCRVLSVQCSLCARRLRLFSWMNESFRLGEIFKFLYVSSGVACVPCGVSWNFEVGSVEDCLEVLAENSFVRKNGLYSYFLYV